MAFASRNLPLIGRRAHQKSRNGCQACKRKKVKCDEKVPCTRCERAEAVCSLTLPPPRAPSSSAATDATESSSDPAPDAFVPSDFGLFHHFITSTSSCLHEHDGKPLPWKSITSNLAPKYPYLLHEILAVAAAHLSYLKPEDPTDYMKVAANHHSRALTYFRAALTAPDANKHALALFSCSALIPAYYFATFDDPSSLLFAPEAPGIPAWTLPLRGCSAVVAQFRDTLDASSVSDLLNSFSLDWRAPELPTPGSSAAQIQLLQREMSTRAPQTEQGLYGGVLLTLGKCFSLSENAGDRSRHRMAAMSFPCMVPLEFLELMSQKKSPFALAIIASWLVLLNKFQRNYWIRGENVPRLMMGVIRSHLYSDYADLIQWPLMALDMADEKIGDDMT